MGADEWGVQLNPQTPSICYCTAFYTPIIIIVVVIIVIVFITNTIIIIINYYYWSLLVKFLTVWHLAVHDHVISSCVTCGCHVIHVAVM